MSSTGDRLRGKTTETMGKTKRELGEASGDDRLREEGEVQEGRGKAQDVKGRIKDKLKDAIDKF